jgi:hypothetical protein
MPVHDKPVVLVGDKPVEVIPLLDERKNLEHVLEFVLTKVFRPMLLVLIVCRCKCHSGLKTAALLENLQGILLEQ